MRRNAVQQLGNQLSRSRRHRQAEHIVPGREEDIVQRRTPIDDRLAIVGHGAPAVPLFQYRLRVGFLKVATRAGPQQVQAATVKRRIVAGKLHRRAEAVGRFHGRDGHPMFFKY